MNTLYVMITAAIFSQLRRYYTHYNFFFLIVKLRYKPCDDRKKRKKMKRKRIRKTALAFFDAKMINNHDGLQAQIYLHPENIFFSFYGKSFSVPFTNGFLPGISLPRTVLYHNACFLAFHSFLSTIAIRTSM